LPAASSQIITVPSSPADAIVLRSELKATALTAPSCPWSRLGGFCGVGVVAAVAIDWDCPVPALKATPAAAAALNTSRRVISTGHLLRACDETGTKSRRLLCSACCQS